MVLKITVLDKLSVHGQFLLIYCQDVIYWGLEEHERILFFCILQEYSVQITFRQQWNDNRLAFDDKGGKYNSNYVLNTNLLRLLVSILKYQD